MAAVRSGRLMGMDMGSMDLEDGRTTGKRKKGKKGGWDGYVQTHRSFSLCIYPAPFGDRFVFEFRERFGRSSVMVRVEMRWLATAGDWRVRGCCMGGAGMVEGRCHCAFGYRGASTRWRPNACAPHQATTTITCRTKMTMVAANASARGWYVPPPQRKRASLRPTHQRIARTVEARDTPE